MFVDKDGKKLQIGSIVSAKKKGRKNFTIKGKVVHMYEDIIEIYDFKKMFKRTFRFSDIKRVRYKGYEDGTYVDF